MLRVLGISLLLAFTYAVIAPRLNVGVCWVRVQPYPVGVRSVWYGPINLRFQFGTAKLVHVGFEQ